MLSRSAQLRAIALGALLTAVVACARDKKPAAAPMPSSEGFITSAELVQRIHPVSPSLAVSADLARKCKIGLLGIDWAPAFEFDESELSAADHLVLGQVARCVNDGHLGTASLRLVGRADPRGTTEYNMALGARRAHSVSTFLVQLGVDAERLEETSRGELDAVGIEEAGWALDRRVDILLVE